MHVDLLIVLVCIHVHHLPLPGREASGKEKGKKRESFEFTTLYSTVLQNYMHEYVPTNHSPGGFLGVLSSSTLRRVRSMCSGCMLVGMAFEPCTSVNRENVLPGLNARSSLDLHIPAQEILFFMPTHE